MDLGCILWSSLAVLSWGIAPFLDKYGLARGNVSAVMFVHSLTITVCIFACMVMKGSSQESFVTSFAKFDWITILAIVGSGIVGGLLGEYAYLKAITGPDTAKAVALTSAYPLVTIIFSFFLLGERLTPSSIGGVLLVLVGVYLLSAGESPEASQEIVHEQITEPSGEYVKVSFSSSPYVQGKLLSGAVVESGYPEEAVLYQAQIKIPERVPFVDLSDFDSRLV
ncbi:MAG: DMT family transporter [Bdellovibrionales bacterium]|nr:DMT family transporter [Bdellovibrionales bacterium]